MKQDLAHTLEAADTVNWTQAQREALIDALVWVKYADDFLAEAEQAAIAAAADAARWAGPIPLADYTLRAATALRQVAGDPQREDAHLASIVVRLATPIVRRAALDACTVASRADGEVDRREADLLIRFRQAILAAEQ
ncbi:MAG: hypothetical protein AAF078_09330 [Planctomycetota bacterium]